MAAAEINDRVGALAGSQGDGSITASYATGNADGGSGNEDRVGALLGQKTGGSLTDSYGFGTTAGEIAGDAGSPKDPGSTRSVAVRGPADLTADNAGTSWDADSNNTLGAWDFDPERRPLLNYADYDGGTATLFVCSQFPADCGTLLPGQGEVSASGAPAVQLAAEATLQGNLLFGSFSIQSWRWQQLEGPRVNLTGADSPELSFTAPNEGAFLVFRLIGTASDGYEYTDLAPILVVESPADGEGNDAPRHEGVDMFMLNEKGTGAQGVREYLLTVVDLDGPQEAGAG